MQRWCAGLAGPALMVMLTLCALFATPVTSRAQVRVDTARTDTLRRPGAPVGFDTTQRPVTAADTAALIRARARADSIAAVRRADTIKTPIAHFETPKALDIDNRYRFTREQILTSEATNLSEILATVPGVTHYATGWLASARLASYNGDFGRVRVFMDGLEMDWNDPRSNGVPDLIDVNLWMLDEIVIERAAGELRVWCRTMTATRTTPFTRTDVYTGDLNTNGFRAIFGRRFMNGMLLQVNGEQYATSQGRQSAFAGATTSNGRGDGGKQTLNARVGFARRKLSVDVFGIVATRDREEQTGRDSTPSIQAFKGARREGYARIAYGDTAQGLWSQVLVGSLRTRLEGIPAVRRTGDTIVVPSDTTRSREQKVFALGYRGDSWQVSATDRLRTFNGQAFHAPAVRAEYATNFLAAGVFAEREGVDSTQHIDATVRVSPLRWLSVAASHSLRMYEDSTVFDNLYPAENESTSRIETNLLWRGRRFSFGAINDGGYYQKAPTLLTGDSTRGNAAPASLGYTVGARGKLWKEIGLDFQAVKWDVPSYYRPQLSTRTDFSVVTNWLSRFPRGQFGINLHVIHELRDGFRMDYGSKTNPGNPFSIWSQRTQVLTTLFELRIQRAVLFYHFHNMTGQEYELVPGIVMPRQVQFYGVRWDFWN